MEILMVLLVVGLMSVLAAPGLQDTLRRNARDAAMRDVLSAIAVARSEAVTRGSHVSLCRSTNQTACAGGNGNNWTGGWIVFTDAGTAGSVTTGDTIIEVKGTGSSQVKITAKNLNNSNVTGDYLRFDGDGYLVYPTTGAYFKFCDNDNVQLNARAVILSKSGRPTISSAQANGIYRDLAGNSLTCP